ncbi:T9SS type A sorting domain-containing protein [Dyadobacter aurulentus]|uniref:T9SS type A sorting domain-containing protein n=1 Tax=Dyadobacter sp. UC 10 TaxID=2605428 RepID=UPI0011F3BBE1|nr:T9SS type A sorting domain-containing protein [Dyadobacter sp. UC 10]KAA0989313.1 T9SS type A sorting domain-containing protein [Dyadobacter sp. UC 10]
MKKYFTPILFLFCFKAMAQCPSTGEVYLYQQSDVDNYFANGGCAVVENLIIGDGSPNITNLNGLNGITTVTGRMFVGWLPLVDFTGLETLTSIGSLSVEWCPSLKNFKGLENLETVNSLSVNEMNQLEAFTGFEGSTITSELYIGGCPALTTLASLSVAESLPVGLMIVGCASLDNLSSLSNLKSAGRLSIGNCSLIEDFQWLSSLESATEFIVGGNANLTSLSGLGNLQTVETFEVTSNTKLASLSGLENLNTVKTILIANNPLLTTITALGNVSSNVTGVQIYSNAQLSNCTVDAICSMLLFPAPGEARVIFGNQGACLDRVQLELACTEALPVTLQSFDAVLEKQVVNLMWKTSGEQNSDKFEVHHSTNGKQWSVIGAVKSTGTGGLGSDYQFTHHTPAHGNNYYRLKMIDFDQSHALSTISHIYYNGNSETVYPNPTSDAIQISSLNLGQIESFELINSTGSIVMKRQGGKTDAINLDKFPAGSYTLRIFKRDSTISNHKIVVRR